MITLDAVSLEALPLRDINLVLPRGTIWGLMGPAAAGKSVLLKIICGLIRPDRGRVIVDQQTLHVDDERQLTRARQQIGMLFQNNALFDFLTVLGNVTFPLHHAGLDPQEAEARAVETLRAVGLAGSEHKLPNQLSGGMKKRAAIARAIAPHPPIVIYDEPTAGLDPVTSSKIYDLLRAHQAAHQATVLTVSSDVDGLSHFCQRISMLHGGMLRYNGPAAAISESDDPVVRAFVRGEDPVGR